MKNKFKNPISKKETTENKLRKGSKRKISSIKYECTTFINVILSLFSAYSQQSHFLLRCFLNFFFSLSTTFINVILYFVPILSLFSVVSVVSAFAELIFKLVFSLATTFINVILRFGHALSLFSVVSVFAEMIFKLIFSFPTTFIDVILCFEPAQLSLSSLSFC